MPSLTYDEICLSIRRAIDERGVENILLSGGEPTIHPDFFRILEFIKKCNVKLSLLTNALRLADDTFAEHMFSIVDGNDLDVTVAFHSYIPEKHDFLCGGFWSVSIQERPGRRTDTEKKMNFFLTGGRGCGIMLGRVLNVALTSYLSGIETFYPL